MTPWFVWQWRDTACRDGTEIVVKAVQREESGRIFAREYHDVGKLKFLSI